MTDLDLIVLGGFYGDGRCSGKLSSFLVGVASLPTNKNNTPSEFSALGSVRSGLSDDDLDEIQLKLRPYWQDAKPHGVIAPRAKVSVIKNQLFKKKKILLLITFYYFLNKK